MRIGRQHGGGTSGQRSGSAAPKPSKKPEGPEWIEKSYEWFQEVHREKFAAAAGQNDEEQHYSVSPEEEGNRFESQEERRAAQAKSRLAMNTFGVRLRAEPPHDVCGGAARAGAS